MFSRTWHNWIYFPTTLWSPLLLNGLHTKLLGLDSVLLNSIFLNLVLSDSCLPGPGLLELVFLGLGLGLLGLSVLGHGLLSLDLLLKLSFIGHCLLGIVLLGRHM